MGIEFGRSGKVGADGQLVEMGANHLQIVIIGDRIGGVTFLPDGQLGVEPVGKSILDEGDGLVEGDGLRGQQEVDVVGHDDVRVKFVEADGAIVQQSVDEEFSDASDLEDGTTVARGSGDIGHTGTGCAYSFGHIAMVGGPGELMNPTNGVSKFCTEWCLS